MRLNKKKNKNKGLSLSTPLTLPSAGQLVSVPLPLNINESLFDLPLVDQHYSLNKANEWILTQIGVVVWFQDKGPGYF